MTRKCVDNRICTFKIALIVMAFPQRKTASMCIYYEFFKLSAYKTGVSMKLCKLQFWSLFKLSFSISGENRSLNGHLRAKFGLN